MMKVHVCVLVVSVIDTCPTNHVEQTKWYSIVLTLQQRCLFSLTEYIKQHVLKPTSQVYI